MKRELSALLGDLRRNPSAIPSRMEDYASEVGDRLSRSNASSLRAVINATGVILHTNLGRAPIDPQLLATTVDVIAGYSNLELDLETGKRGRRNEHLSDLAARLFGCEAALLVNNNASAVLLLLAALGRGREVIVSRGELVEIGGSFRVPEVIVQGGAILREVGTTNRTRVSDYAEAISGATSAILRVHRSNFDIVGFTESPSFSDLARLAAERGVPLLYDEGSGRVVDLEKYGFSTEPTLAELFRLGVTAVSCSTDKLIGATQGGLILGTREIIEKCGRHPLMRALRAGKESYAIIGETLRAFLAGQQEERIPIYRMLAMPKEDLRLRAAKLAGAVGGTVVETRVALGGGTTPTETTASCGIAFEEAGEALRDALLRLPRPVIVRMDEGKMILDLRTVLPEDDANLMESLKRVMADSS